MYFLGNSTLTEHLTTTNYKQLCVQFMRKETHRQERTVALGTGTKFKKRLRTADRRRITIVNREQAETCCAVSSVKKFWESAESELYYKRPRSRPRIFCRRHHEHYETNVQLFREKVTFHEKLKVKGHRCN
jgi:hypothetical protein